MVLLKILGNLKRGVMKELVDKKELVCEGNIYINV